MNRYLGTNPDQSTSQIRARAPDWFEHAEQVADYAGGLVLRLHVNRGDLRQLLAALLFRRVASAYEAVVMLGERGMHTEGLTQRRSMLEALFVLGAVWKKPEFVDEFMRGDKHRVFRIYKGIKRLSPEIQGSLLPELSPNLIDAKIAELKLSTSGPKAKHISEYADAAELTNYYLTDYSFSSESAHHVAKDLERHIALDSNGDIDGFFWGPEPELPTDLLSHAVEYMLMAICATETLFEFEATSTLSELRTRNDSLSAALAASEINGPA